MVRGEGFHLTLRALEGWRPALLDSHAVTKYDTRAEWDQ